MGERMRISIFGIALFLCCCAMAAFAQEAAPERTEPVRISYCIDCIPFQFEDETGQAAGLLIDLWHLWSEKTGDSVVFSGGKWNDALSSVRDGTADVHAGLFYSEARDAFLDFAAPLRVAESHFFFHRSITGLSDATGLTAYRVGALKNDFTGSYLARNFPGLVLAEYDNYQAMLTAAERGEIRVFANLTTTLLYMMSEAGITENYRYYSNRPLFKEAWTPAVRDGNSAMRKRINDGLALITEEERHAVAKRWSGTEPTETDRLVIAMDRNFPPFTQINAVGEPAGLLVDLWRLWAIKTGRKIEFSPGSWTETLLAIQNGEADIHAGLYRNEARDEWADFSDPIYETGTSIHFLLTDAPPQSFEALAGLQVGVVEDSYHDTFLTLKYPAIIAKRYQDDTETVRAARRGEIDAVIGEDVSIDAVLDDLGLRGQFARSDAAVYANFFYAAVADGRADLITLINQGLDQISDEERRDIEERWISISQIDTALMWRIAGAVAVVFIVLAVWIVVSIRQRRLLADAAGRMRRILETSPIAVAVIDLETNRAVFANRRVAEMFGFNEEILKTVDPESIWVEPSVRADMINEVKQGHEIIDRELRMRRADGSPVWDILSLIPMEFEGRPSMIAWHFDISARKSAEEQARASEQRMLTILESSPVGVSVTNLETNRAEFANQRICEIFGIDPADIADMDPSVIWADLEARAAIVEKIKDGKAIHDHEVLMRRIDGTPVWDIITLLPMEFEGQPALLAWHYDISLRKQAEEHARKAHELVASSIRYASRIQRSILPDNYLLTYLFSDYFIHWEPRDVVGGDIYWGGRWGDGALFMVGDCTGHGVPGAFMTLIGVGALERALMDTPHGDVSTLMTRIHQMVQLTTNQHLPMGESDDGMELGLCYLHPNRQRITYCGARFSLFVVNRGEVEEIKGARAGIGYRGIPHDQDFGEMVVEITPDHVCYLTSDGIIDQIGGPKQRAFGKRRFKALLADIADQPFETQRQTVINTLSAYQGSQIRRDDVTVAGFRIEA